MTQRGGQVIQWSSFNKPKRFSGGGFALVDVVYGSDRQRILKQSYKNGLTTATQYIGGVMEVKRVGSDVDYKLSVQAGGQTVATLTKKLRSGLLSNHKQYYLHDHGVAEDTVCSSDDSGGN